MQSRYRLRRRQEIAAVKQDGRAIRDRLVVLVYRPNNIANSRFCFSASKRVGNAPQRNRARRLLREATRLNLDKIKPGWDCIWIARSQIVSASYQQVETALLAQLAQAGLLTE